MIQNNLKFLLMCGVGVLMLQGCANQLNDSLSLDSTQPRTSVAQCKSNINVNRQNEDRLAQYFFDFDRSSKTVSDVSSFKTYANKINKSNNKVLLIGNTDKKGPQAYNYNLGRNRANYIAKKLIQAGVSKDKLTVISNGDAYATGKLNNEAAMAKDRRVDIYYERS